ncbi:hypothetical protein [Endozoicomonas sp. ONNA1]|uniref:hypothetical protein n=1 Tax=Endozoicomonas sp. ONNA1 TaxID=2828740 RepID=UPI00214981EB|nr:hypothetical protein [Endozoicomonas sp. ONNA1]
MIKHSLSIAPMLLLLLLLSVSCQAETLTRCFIVELQQKTDSSAKQSFSIKRDQHTYSGIADTNGYRGSDSPPDNKPPRAAGFRVKTPLIELISWQWLYSTYLLFGHELIHTINTPLLSSNPYPWLPLEMLITVGWLLKNYWNPNSPLFNLIEQQIEQHEASYMLTQVDHPFATITMMHGSGHAQQQGQLLESSDQQGPQANTRYIDSFTGSLYSDSGGGNRNPGQHRHTLSLNCFVDTCAGVCQFRQSADHDAHAQYNVLLKTKSSDLQKKGISFTFTQLPSAADSERQYIIYKTVVDINDQPKQFGKVYTISKALSGHKRKVHSGQKTCNETVLGEDGQRQRCGKVCESSKTLSAHKRKDHSGKQTCNEVVVGDNGQPQSCGVVSKNAQALSSHKNKYHTEKKTCDVIVDREDGQQQPCGEVCMTAYFLSAHKSRVHSNQKTCDVIVEGEHAQRRPCGIVCKNAQALSDHKRMTHSGPRACNKTVVVDGHQRPCGTISINNQALTDHKRSAHGSQQTCDVSVVEQDSQQRPCGKVCKNARALWSHKRNDHSGQKTCVETITGEDGQLRPCGKICKNIQSLSTHKSQYHTGQKTCELTVVGENGHQRQCGTIWTNALAVSCHKRRDHSWQQICNKPVVGETGHQRPCGTIWKNARALWDHKRRVHNGQQISDKAVAGMDGSAHKRTHRKRKLVDLDQDDDLSPQKRTVNQ